MTIKIIIQLNIKKYSWNLVNENRIKNPPPKCVPSVHTSARLPNRHQISMLESPEDSSCFGTKSVESGISGD